MKTRPPEDLLLRIALHPPRGPYELHIRPMTAAPGPGAAIPREGRGRWAVRRPPGHYLVTFTGEGLRPEARPVALFADRHLDLFPVAAGARRVRIGDRRVPAALPATAVDAFLVESADLDAVLDVLAFAADRGLRFQPDRAVDDGTRVLADKLLLPVDGEGGGDPREEPLPAYLRRLAVARRRAAELGPLRVTRDLSAVLPFVAASGGEARAAVEALRGHPTVLAAGSALRRGPHPAVRRPAIDLRLLPGVAPARLFEGRVSRRLRRAVLRPRGVDRFRLELPDGYDEVIEDLIDGLLQTGLVVHATPDIAERCALLDGDGGDALSAGQWDLKRLGVPEAHAALVARGRRPGAGARLAVIDSGVRPIAGQAVHADLIERVALYDERGRPGGHEWVVQGHGGSVAALAAGTDHPGQGPGIAGVAPCAAVAAYKYNGALAHLEDVLEIAGGLRPTGAGPADVVLAAMRFGATWSLPEIALAPATLPAAVHGPGPDALTRLAHAGRSGRGCLVVLAAGNEGRPLAEMNPIATSTDALTCGASDVRTADGGADGLASQSNFGPELDALAPGYLDGRSRTLTVGPAMSTGWPARALVRGTVRAVAEATAHAVRLDVELPSAAAPIPEGARVLLGPLADAETLWRVEAVSPSGDAAVFTLHLKRIDGAEAAPAVTAGVEVGVADVRWARLGGRFGSWYRLTDVDPNRPPADWVTLVSADGYRRAEVLVETGTLGGDTPVARFRADEPPTWLETHGPVEVWHSASGHQKTFGQSSAASALCAGVGALVLSANPALTGFEARAILLETARVLDGPAEFQGAGRLDAAAAVAAALAYDHPRDLWLKTADAPPGDPAPDSEDVWLTHTPLDPADPGALPTAHEDLDPTRTAWICARVRNRGPDAASLDARIRFVLAAAPSDGRFEWPRDWTPRATGAATALPPGSYLLGEAPLPAGIPPGAAHVVQIPWPAWATPHAGSSWTCHVLVEVTPHDGRQTGDGRTIADNANLALRRVERAAP